MEASVKIAVVGVGNLGSALVKGILSEKLAAPSELLLYNRSMTEYLTELKEQGVVVRGPRQPSERLDPIDVVLFAVKPQEVASALGPWRGALPPSTLVLSVMAGVTVSTISRHLGGHDAIVRAMPNLGVYVGRSATGMFAPVTLSAEQVSLGISLFEKFGDVYQLLEEQMLDGVTAIAGSGPAYICWLAEQMIASSTEFGFDREQARSIVVQTLLGTAHLLQQRECEPAFLRELVTSKGGTTAAALKVLELSSSAACFEQAFHAARARAKELSNELSDD